MKKYGVVVREVHYATYVVEADSAEDAKERYERDGGEFYDSEFSEVLDEDCPKEIYEF